MKEKKHDDDGEISKNDLKTRIQKKLASSLVNKSTLKSFLSDEEYAMLETMYQIYKLLLGRKDAKKFIHDIIKISTKIFILYRNKKFKPDEETALAKMDTIMNKIYKVAITFWSSSDFADVEYFCNTLKGAEEIVAAIAKSHLTSKSQKRVESVFKIAMDRDKLSKILVSPSPEMEPHIKNLVASLTLLLGSKS